MANHFSMDTSELNKLAIDLGDLPPKVLAKADAVLKRGAVEVKKEMQELFRRSPHFKGVAPAVNFDRIPSATGVVYEIGPQIGKYGGSLGGIAVEGGANGGGGSVDIDGILPAEANVIEHELGKVLGDLA